MDQVGVADRETVGQRLSVQAVLSIGRAADDKGRPSWLIEGDLPELRSAKDILRRGRADRIEAKMCKHLPGRHLSSIVVAGESPRRIIIFRGQDMANLFACLFRMPGH